MEGIGGAAGEPGAGPLAGYRVLELGHYIAAPFASRLLGDLGADVIKVEAPQGDPVRLWGERHDGQSIWWSLHGRNKRCVTLNLKSPAAKDILAGLVRESDAVIENFRAGQLSKMGYGDEFLKSCNPSIVICHISGFGQTGPKSEAACFGVIGEALGGLRYLTNHMKGHGDLPPVRVGISIGDSVAGLYAALGVAASLASRDRRTSKQTSKVIDVALTEAVLSLLEGTIPEYGKLGKIREPSGGRIPTAAPSNAFPTSDGNWVIIAANSDQLFVRLCDLMGRSDLAKDPRYIDNIERCRNVDALEAAITEWTRELDAQSLEALLARSDIPACRVYRAPEIVADEQYRARGMILNVDDPLVGPVLHPAPVPRFTDVPRRVRWPGPSIGQHNYEVYREALNLSPEDVEGLRREGVV